MTQILFDIGNGPTPLDPDIMATGRVPVSNYTSQEWFQRESELFGRTWLNIARIEEVARNGDWIVRDIPCRSTSVLITRGGNGVLKAFHNVCTHRSMQLVWEEQGHGARFVCPYHAWTFGLDGRLEHLPDEACFRHVDKSELGLRPVALEVWEGFVFVNLDPKPAMSLADFLQPLTDRFRDAPFGEYPHTFRIAGVLDMNWKLALEAQSENYHVRALHSRTVSSMIVHKDNPFGHYIHYESLGAHSTYSSPRNPSFGLSSDRHVQNFALSSSAFITTLSDEQDRASLADFPGFNPTRSTLWAADQIRIFPHLTVNVGSNGWWLHRFWPVAPDKTHWEVIYFFKSPQSVRDEFALSYFAALNRDTLMEDMIAVGKQQYAMTSGAVPHIHFGDQEDSCKQFAAVVSAAVQAPGPQSQPSLRGEQRFARIK